MVRRLVSARRGESGVARRALLCLFSSLSPCLSLLSGCIGSPANPAATRSATDVDPAAADGAYWYARPGAVSVTSPDFERLWTAAQEAARDAGFRIDRRDYRSGVMTTQPLVSRQLWEVWRRDVAALPDLAKSTLQTLRRTVRFEIGRRDDGTYELVPKVLVERYSFAEHRITSVALYREVFALTPQEVIRRRDLQENPTQAPTGVPPPEYWYAIGRDPHLERRLADWIRHDLPAESSSHAAADADMPPGGP